LLIKFDGSGFESGSCSCNKLSTSSIEADDPADENVSGTAALKLFLL
jgi:hypothetical protein